MNRKLNYMNLAEELALRLHITQGEAETFMRTFFDTIEQGLSADQQVKIKGLGTFKLNEMGARGSIDVNTGERITIQGYNKISFTPENALKDRINKPFAQFETTELDDQYGEEESAEEPEDISLVASLEEEKAEGETVEAVAEAADAPIIAPLMGNAVPETPVEEHAETSVETTEPEIEPKESEEADTEPTASEETAVPVEEAEETAVEQAVSEEPDAPVVAVEENKEATAEPATAVETTETAMEVQDAEDAISEPERPSEPQAPEEPEPKEPTQAKKRKKPRKTWRYWLPIVLLLLLAGGLYIYTLVGRQPRTARPGSKDTGVIKVETIDFDDEAEPSAPAVEAPDTLSDDTLTTAADTIATIATVAPVASEQPTAAPVAEPKATATATSNGKLVLAPALAARNIKDITAADTCDYTMAGTLASHELQNGETLTRLALQYYGDKRLWPYIVKYNWMKDYNNVHPGIIVNIPNLKIKE